MLSAHQSRAWLNDITVCQDDGEEAVIIHAEAIGNARGLGRPKEQEHPELLVTQLIERELTSLDQRRYCVCERISPRHFKTSDFVHGNLDT